MKKTISVKVLQKIISILLIIVMMFSYFPMFVLAEETDENVNTNNYVSLNANWITSGSDTLEAETSTAYQFDYNIVLTGITGQFTNIQMTIFNKNDDTPVATITPKDSPIDKGNIVTNEPYYNYNYYNIGNHSSGTELSGSNYIVFKNKEDKSWYTKEISIILTGNYINPITKEEETFTLEKCLNANVKPKDEIKDFSAAVNMQKDSNGISKNVNISGVIHDLGMSEYGRTLGWYRNVFSIAYPIHIDSYTYTQMLELKVTINRITNGVSKAEDNYSINWDGLNTLFDNNFTVTHNNDGSYTYTFTKGENSDNFIEENTFLIDQDFNVVITYAGIDNNYNELEENCGLNEESTTCTFVAELEAAGFNVRKEYNKNGDATETNTSETKTSILNKTNNVSLYGFTPGNHAWISVSLNSIDSSYIENIDDFINNGTMDFSFSTRIDNDCNWGDMSEENGKIVFSQPEITYLSDEGVIETKTLSSNEIRLKSISENNGSYSKSTLQYGEESEIEINDLYTISDNVNINNYSINLYNFLYNKFNGFSMTYTLSAEQLMSVSGLTENEIKNISQISFEMSTSGSRWIEGSDILSYYNINSMGNKYSYMEFDIGEDFGTELSKANKIESKTLTISMYKNTNVIRSEILSVYNQNPVLYVQLPSQFIYSKINVQMTENPYISINEDNLDFIEKNGETYLLIPCNGTYDSTLLEKLNITITFNRKLRRSASVGTNNISAYMITDNERYIKESSNKIYFEKIDFTETETTESIIPEKIFAITKSFEVGSSSIIGARTTIETSDGVEYSLYSNGETAVSGEYENPIVIDAGETITYRSKLESTGETLTNIIIFSRLPIAGNKSFATDTMESYELIDDSSIQKVSLNNLNNIKIYEEYERNNNIYKQELNSSYYTIYYSTVEEPQESEYVQYTEGADLTDVKNLKVVFSEDYSITSGKSVYLEYQMTMPEQSGMAGSITLVEYEKDDGTATQSQSSAAYVINGDTDGTINIQKTFEGYTQGNAPDGISLSGIEFKLLYKNEDGEKVFLQSEGNDAIATTDNTGMATFTNVPYGTYYLYEVTEFENYAGIGNITIIDLERAETVTVTAENRLKRGTLTINKKWNDTNDQQGTVKFTVTRTSSDNITYSRTIETDENGIAVLYNVPYGDYKVVESTGVAGWAPETEQVNITIDEETEELDFTNRLGIGKLTIVKNVPQGETVDGLNFHIKSLGMVSYTNTNGELVSHNEDFTITVGTDYSSNGNINIVKSNNDTTAIITISNLYLGLYNIEEIDIEKIDANGTQIDKYVAAFKQVQLSNDGDYKTTTINNVYKRGNLVIQKTAKLNENGTYTDIGDLSCFSVNITGTSWYGTDVNEIVTLDENGYASINLEIGNYTITELNTDGYNVYYGQDKTASTEPATVTINYNKSITQHIYNEHVGVGYVRVEKTLEGISNPQKVIDAGIEFKVVGQNVAGGRVEETIKIDKIDTENNVAYGVSGPISSGGEYQLEEVESTVPDFFESIDPIEIDLTTAHTTQTPLVIEAVNTRTHGDLEIITQTNPTGGPLTGIIYNVTEVNINKNGTYERVGETITLEGNNDTVNTSFAKLEDIYAGYYLVEQVTVPDGWQKDVSQIVGVPSYSIGYVTFEITEIPELSDNKVTINKQILNSNNEIATSEDFASAELNENETFEVKITNVQTQEVYYTFISNNEPGVIVGLNAGTYEIEEVYKPKYTTEGYYTTAEEINPESGELEPIEYTIYPVENKYMFTIEENQDELIDVNITIKNIINTDFGFGGQDSKLNYSKVDVEDVKLVTKTIIYVVDEENNAISGVKFQLINEEGKVVRLINSGTEFEVDGKRIVLEGLPAGKYTLVNTEYPDGYLKPEDIEIIVFPDVTLVSNKIEVQKNVPRGNLTLSTVYTTDEGDTKYVSRSKYKVVDTETGELVKFTRTATGDYRKTNLEGASPLIVLKSGAVYVEGLEVGTYEVGIVDVTKGYGVQTTLPETISVVENTTENVSVEVINKNIVQVEAGYLNNMYLDESGNLYVWGENYNCAFGNNGDYYDSTSIPTKIEFPEENVKIVKVSQSYQSRILALDTEGRVWAWGTASNLTDLTTPTLITDSENNNIICKDIVAAYQTEVLLDINGKVWTMGLYNGDGTTTTSYSYKCITDIEGTDLYKSYYEQGITIERLADYSGYPNSHFGLIDSIGRVWVFGFVYNSSFNMGIGTPRPAYSPICLSDDENENLKDIKIESLTTTEKFFVALDDEGNVWIWGNNGAVVSTVIQQTNRGLPYKIDSSLFGNSKITKVTAYSDNSEEGVVIAVDEYGRVWSWGVGSTGQLGQTLSQMYTPTPVCISDDETENLYGIEIKDISICKTYSYNGYSGGYVPHVIAVDTNNRVWCWGGFSSTAGISGTLSLEPIAEPRNVAISYNEHLEYNLKFKEVYTDASGSNSAFAIDEEGRVWSWGYSNSGDAHLGYVSYTNVYIPTLVEMPENAKIKKVQAYYHHTMMLSEDGRVFVCGDNDDGLFAIGSAESMNSYGRTITEITEKFNLSSDVQIVDIVIPYYGTYIALDSEGKVYTWGTGSNIGRDDSENKCEIVCISDTPDEILYSKKIEKISGTDSGVIAIDDTGKVYGWGSCFGSTTPICLTDKYSELNKAFEDGVKIVDIQNKFLLDNNGKLWNADIEYNVSNYICVSNMPEGTLYKMYETDENYKIIKMYNFANSGEIIVKDNNNQLWYINENNEVFKIGEIPSYEIKANLMPSDIISLCGHLLVDSQGQIWAYRESGAVLSGTGSTEDITQPTCLAETTFEANKVLVNKPIENNLYGVEFETLVNDNFAIDTNGNVWYFGNSIQAINLTEQFQGVENPFYGKEVARLVNNNYVITTDNEIWYIGGEYPVYIMDALDKECEYLVENYTSTSGYYLALDEDGKIWVCGYLNGLFGITERITKPVCVSDLEGAEELRNAYETDNSFEIVEITSTWALDNKGKIWAWSGTYLGENLGTYPVCISDIEGTELNSAYDDENFAIEKIYYIDSNNIKLIDNNGKVWTYGSSAGNGKVTTNEFICISNIPDTALYEEHQSNEDFGIEKVVVSNDYRYEEVLIGNNGKVYHTNYYNEYDYYQCIDNNMSGVTSFVHIYTYSVTASGVHYYRLRYLAYGTDGVYQVEVGGNYAVECSKISITNIQKIVKFADDNAILALDENGKIWSWGRYSDDYPYGITTTSTYISQCLSDNSNFGELYNKKVVDIKYIGNEQYVSGTVVAETEDGELYAWGRYANDTPELFTHCDEFVKVMIGDDITNENRIKVLEMLSTREYYSYGSSLNSGYGYKTIYEKDNQIYSIIIDKDNKTITSNKNLNLTKQYLGNGTIEEILDNEYVKLTDGTILHISENGDVNEVPEYTPSTEEQEQATPVEIDGANIVAYTNYKALDDQGNLYVWDNYTGFTSVKEGRTCITTTEYDVEPVYTNKNGWSVVKNQY